jgi:hypothetical protein
MYLRIKNQLDAEIFAQELYQTPSMSLIADRILELTETLDDSYGSDRSSRDMGGYILFFPSEKEYRKCISVICKTYHIEPSLCEYREIIGEKAISGTEWWEELFLLSSDDALVFIHPQKAEVENPIKK